MPRSLIVNADDFGFTRDVNAGIVEAFQRGILRSTTLMANGPAFDDAVRLAKEHPGLDVGVHLVLVEGESVARPGEALPGSLGALLRRLTQGWPGREIEAEFEAQVEKILAAGLRPTHLDAHKHTHLAPPVLGALLRVGRRHGIRWVRRPFDVPLTAAAASAPWRRRLVNRALRPLGRRFEHKISRAGLRSTDAFAGFQFTGAYKTEELVALIRRLPEGVTELMTHPGFCTDELRSARTRLKESRAAELEALTSPAVAAAVREAGIEIRSFAGL